MQRKQTVMGASVIVVIVALVAVAFALQPSAADILTGAAQTLEAAQDGHAVIELSATTPEQSGTAIVEVWGRRPAAGGHPAFRVEVLESSFGNAGMVAVSDGTQFWLWDPGENKVLVGSADDFKDEMAERSDHDPEDYPDTPEAAVEKLLEYFTASREGSEDVAGSSATKLTLLPIPEQLPERFALAGGWLNVWVNADNVPVAAEYTGGALGAARATATLVELNVGLSDDLFIFDIPDGAEVVNAADLQPESISLEEATAVGVLTPGELPDGATLVDVFEVRGAVVQRYALAGGGSFTVAQGDEAPTPSEDGQAVAVRGTNGTLYASDDGTRTLLAWVEGERSYWVGGDLSAEQALAVAESLK